MADEIETVIYLAQYLDPASVQRYWDVGDPAARVLLASCTDRGVPDTLLDRLFAALDTPLGVQSLTALACAADPRAEEELHRRAGIAGDPLQATAITLLKDLRPAPLREPLSRQAPTDPPGAVPPAYMPPPP